MTIKESFETNIVGFCLVFVDYWTLSEILLFNYFRGGFGSRCRAGHPLMVGLAVRSSAPPVYLLKCP